MKPIKILVAEDEETIREFIVINLKRAGYEVVEAFDGLDAYEKYKLDPDGISIAVLDIMMPRMDGLELCKKLRAMSNNIGIMMLTAKTQEMDKVNGLLLGQGTTVTISFDIDHVELEDVWDIDAAIAAENEKKAMEENEDA